MQFSLAFVSLLAASVMAAPAAEPAAEGIEARQPRCTYCGSWNGFNAVLYCDDHSLGVQCQQGQICVRIGVSQAHGFGCAWP